MHTLPFHTDKLIRSKYFSQYNHKVCKGSGKPGKAWSFILTFSRTGNTWKKDYRFWKVLEICAIQEIQRKMFFVLSRAWDKVKISEFPWGIESGGSEMFSLSHARDKTKSIFLYFFTALKTSHLSYSIFKQCSFQNLLEMCVDRKENWFWNLGNERV